MSIYNSLLRKLCHLHRSVQGFGGMPEPWLLMVVLLHQSTRMFYHWNRQILGIWAPRTKWKLKTTWVMSPARCDFIISPQELSLLFSSAVPINYPKEGTVPMVLSRNQLVDIIFDAERSALFSWAIRVFPSSLLTFWGL